ncbi:MAG: DinB family protein [Chloroflexi bacterium]|nr:DinB family protein [Chloroflexota bacterium]
MDAITLLREQLTEACTLLMAIIQDLTPEAAHWISPGQANPVGATYAHVVLFEDRSIKGILLDRRPLYETTWSGKTGMSELMPKQGPEWNDYADWTRRLKVELAAVRKYAKAIYANSDRYLSSLTPDDLDTPIDLAGVGGSNVTLGHVLSRSVVGHVDNISGEISCLRGLQGIQGYPF